MKTHLSPMAKLAKLQIKKLPEGVYLATSNDIPGLVAQGNTIKETIEIARDVAIKIRELREDFGWSDSNLPLSEISDSFEFPLIFES